MLAVVDALAVWPVYLVGSPVVVKDNAALEWFDTQPNLSQRQARWSIAIQKHDAKFNYIPGRTNIVADALGCRSDLQAAPLLMALQTRARDGTVVASPAEPRRSKCRRTSEQTSEAFTYRHLQLRQTVAHSTSCKRLLPSRHPPPRKHHLRPGEQQT